MMFILRQGQVTDATRLRQLIYASAPTLLAYLFGDKNAANAYLAHALIQDDGQYCAHRHQVLVVFDQDTKQECVVGCITLWHDQLGNEFKQQTLKTIKESCSTLQIARLSQINRVFQSVFPAPKTNEIALGHISVLPEYQGLGLGKKLIAYGLRHAKQLGKSHAILDVESANEQAVSFYDGCDFMPGDEKKIPAIDRTFLRMVYRLS